MFWVAPTEENKQSGVNLSSGVRLEGLYKTSGSRKEPKLLGKNQRNEQRDSKEQKEKGEGNYTRQEGVTFLPEASKSQEVHRFGLSPSP